MSQKPHAGSQKMREYTVALGFADFGFQLSWIFGHEQEKNRDVVFLFASLNCGS